MAAPTEVLLTTDSSGQLWNACVWDPHSGTSLLTYKGHSTGPRGLCVLGGELLLGAVHNKPIIQVWHLQKKEQPQMKMVCPGKVTSLAVTGDATYCVAGIEDKIHVWQVATGNLLAVLSRHYQTVTCLEFTDDDSCFVSGGDDNLVIVWSLQSVLCEMSEPSVRQEPLYVWTAHSLPITDICVGAGGRAARVVSSSLDHTCRLWDLSSGTLLLSILFDTSVTSVRMDSPEYRLFAGTSIGKILAVNLFTQPVRTERHISSKEKDENVTQFEGHSKQVTCLEVSFDGSRLFSGSHDCCMKLWDVLSGQCLRTIEHKGAVTNVVTMLAPRSMFVHGHKPAVCIQPFKRHLHSEEESRADNSSSNTLESVCMRILHSSQSFDNQDEKWSKALAEEREKGNNEADSTSEQKILSLEETVSELQQTNRELYEFSLNFLQNKSQVT